MILGAELLDAELAPCSDWSNRAQPPEELNRYTLVWWALSSMRRRAELHR
ncbi:hypothetical protein [Streptomyces sp. NPDC059909]